MKNAINPILVAGIWAIFSTVPLLAQDFQRNPPPGSKVPLATNGTVAKPAPPVVESKEPIDENLGVFKGIVIMGSPKDFQRLGVSGVSDVVVKGPPFLVQHASDVKRLVKPYFGKPLTFTALRGLQADLIRLSRGLDRPVVDVFYPQQEIINGTAQIIVYEGKLGRLIVDFQGRKWFSERFITKRIHLHPGDSISQKQLLRDIDGLNHNPTFREVSAAYKPGEFKNERTNDAAVTDIDIKVKDRFPLRFFAGYDDYGLKVLGENRVFAGFSYGNLFGVDQQLNFKYITDTSLDHLQTYSGSYVIPLPWWGQTLTFFGGYNNVRADLSQIGFPINNNGDTYQVSMRYDIPLPQMGALDQDISIGYDFKSADTAVEFGKFSFSPFAADIDQIVGEYKAYLKDGWGSSQLALNGYYSPGGLLGKNSDSDFATFHSGLKADYYYGRASAERDFILPGGFALVGKGGYQNTSTGLLPSEQIYLGGYSLIRGYPENIVSGDEGWYGTAEAHWFTHTGNLSRQKNVPGLPGGIDGDSLDLYGFFDYGSVEARSPNTPFKSNLSSVGPGVNYQMSQ
jgi:hemolysin activation/secretion protein